MEDAADDNDLSILAEYQDMSRVLHQHVRRSVVLALSEVPRLDSRAQFGSFAHPWSVWDIDDLADPGGNQSFVASPSIVAEVRLGPDQDVDDVGASRVTEAKQSHYSVAASLLAACLPRSCRYSSRSVTSISS